MKRRNRLRNGRKQVQFGADGAIMAAATLAAAGINAGATASAASQQAAAVESAAKTQADSIKLQTENANKLQQQSLDFTKEQNETNRDLQKDIQMNLQLLTGQQTLNDIKDASKIQVRNGGSMKKRLSFSLRGKNIPGIETPHNGSYIPIAYTPDGILAMITGPSHDNGGVDIDVNGNKDIEAEGGELMHIKYGLGGSASGKGIRDIEFISRHKIPGTDFNPAEEVLSGDMTPNQAFKIQQGIKYIKGISDDGKHNTNSPVRRLRYAGGTTTIPITPDLSLDFLAPVTTGVVAGTRNNMKCGGKIRHKFAGGGKPWQFNLDDIYNFANQYNANNTAMRFNNIDATSATPKGSSFWNNYGGATINAGANLLGAGITTIGNIIGGRRLANAYNLAGNILSSAYDKMHGIDMNAIKKEDYQAAHAMAALQAPIVHTGAERAAAERSLQRNLRRINRGTLSSAAAQNRSAMAESEYNDRISQIESNADKIRQGIMQENMQRITQVSNENANRDIQANQTYANAYLNLLQYNNDIENEKIAGKAQAQADALTQTGATKAGIAQSVAGNWAAGLTGAGNAYASQLAMMSKARSDEQMALLGATDSSILRWVYDDTVPYNRRRSAARSLWNRYKASKDDNYKNTANELNNMFHFE